jgi:predicted nucleic acid-binding protein
MNLLIVDTNIVFSSLISFKRVSHYFDIISEKVLLVSGSYLIKEIEEHWERISSFTGLPLDVLFNRLNFIKSQVYFFDLEEIPVDIVEEAKRIGKMVDQDDIPFIALSLHFGGPIWTGDKQLKRGLEMQGYFICMTSNEIIQTFGK